MTRPVTLFTGQWADLPFEEVCRKVSAWGYDGLEIACWGDHMDLDQASKISSNDSPTAASCACSHAKKPRPTSIIALKFRVSAKPLLNLPQLKLFMK